MPGAVTQIKVSKKCSTVSLCVSPVSLCFKVSCCMSLCVRVSITVCICISLYDTSVFVSLLVSVFHCASHVSCFVSLCHSKCHTLCHCISLMYHYKCLTAVTQIKVSKKCHCESLNTVIPSSCDIDIIRCLKLKRFVPLWHTTVMNCFFFLNKKHTIRSKRLHIC